MKKSVKPVMVDIFPYQLSNALSKSISHFISKLTLDMAFLSDFYEEEELLCL